MMLQIQYDSTHTTTPNASANGMAVAHKATNAVFGITRRVDQTSRNIRSQ